MTANVNRRAALGGLCLFAFSPPAFATPDTRAAKLIAAARSQIGRTIRYDPAYSQIAYPGGDVPMERGVCTDVVIRAYRQALAIDLQQQVHEDMASHFSAYPKAWGLNHADANIDHRRVPNLRVFFERHAAARNLPVSAAEVQPGDVVTMKLPGNLDHIALAGDKRDSSGARPLLIHNIGAGTQEEDILFRFPLTGHYRYAL